MADEVVQEASFDPLLLSDCPSNRSTTANVNEWDEVIDTMSYARLSDTLGDLSCRVARKDIRDEAYTTIRETVTQSYTPIVRHDGCRLRKLVPLQSRLYK